MKQYFIETYRCENQSCERFIEENGSIFQSYRFLSIVGDDYRCICLKTGTGEIIAALPLTKTTKYGLKAFHIPAYAYQFGPVVHLNHLSEYAMLVKKLLEKLPKSGHYDFKIDLLSKDVIPFKESGFTVTTNQSHIKFAQNIFDDSFLAKDKRRDIKKLKKLYEAGEIQIAENDQENIPKLLYLWEKTSERSNFNGHLNLLKQIFNADFPHYSNTICDKDGNPYSGTFCPYDKYTMYHLIGASLRVDSRILSRTNMLSLYLALEYANSKKINFDFEGSNLPGVAKFYRMMGGKPKLIYRAQKTQSIYYQFLRFGENWRRERK